jgi:putative membrane protein
MAWTRTGVALMGFGFVIERFGLFLHMFMAIEGEQWQRDASFWVGICFILLGALVEVSSVMQYRSVLKTLKPIEIPEGYWVNIGMYTNLAVAMVGVAIIFYFFFGLQ